jgi:hypothetical protein
MRHPNPRGFRLGGQLMRTGFSYAVQELLRVIPHEREQILISFQIINRLAKEIPEDCALGCQAWDEL